LSLDSESPSEPKPLLWVSVTHPGSRHAGNQVYSGGLLDALTARSQPVTLLTRNDGPSIPGLTVVAVPPNRFRPRVSGLASRWPASVWQAAGPNLQRNLRALLGQQAWRAVVIDQAASGWAAPLAAAAQIPLVYVAHNHEGSTRKAVAKAEPSPLRRLILRYDACKYARLEQALVRQAALVTAITESDARQFTQQVPSARVLTLPPGYAGQSVGSRTLDQTTPRRIVLVGRFEWIAKQLNLTRWAEHAVPMLAAAGIETQVVGTVPDTLRTCLARAGLSFTGPVPSVAPFLAKARYGLVAEDVGGGFKLKTLDYIFHRLPIAALDGNLEGQPPGVLANTLTAPTPKALAKAIVTQIDDLERLNQMQQNAFGAAIAAFDWADRAQRFLHALESLD
jgi:polysaccharide biosynthesis protein PslH